jgi:hypothetical protein
MNNMKKAWTLAVGTCLMAATLAVAEEMSGVKTGVIEAGTASMTATVMDINGGKGTEVAAWTPYASSESWNSKVSWARFQILPMLEVLVERCQTISFTKLSAPSRSSTRRLGLRPGRL